jgi:hypothetical protein
MLLLFDAEGTHNRLNGLFFWLSIQAGVQPVMP